MLLKIYTFRYTVDFFQKIEKIITNLGPMIEAPSFAVCSRRWFGQFHQLSLRIVRIRPMRKFRRRKRLVPLDTRGDRFRV